jgi:hypothetical protein
MTMSRSIYLALAIHNHQPIGNFSFVFAEAYEKAYEPFVALLERHPDIRLTLHYSGPLRDWLAINRPDLLRRIALLVKRGQVEMMTGGYYEPLLAIIPDADKLGQTQKLTRQVKEDFGYEATGAWLAERVWEPHLAKPLAEAGIEYIVVDDTHFKWVGLTGDLFGYYVTEEQGAPLKIFPSSKSLRYSIPWRPLEEVISFLREQATEAGGKVSVMGDDGEKFGLWPGTYEHVWKNGWLEKFFIALEENSDWLRTITLGEYAHRYRASGRIYLPTASYEEMTEWALPATLAAEIVELKHTLQNEGRDDILRFTSGGFWRYFLVKYPEINDMHKKMLLVHEKVYAMPPSDDKWKALDELWQGQCNCPYWHGIFGGIYLPHIRTANYHHLVTAENLADKALHPAPTWLTHTATDLRCDAQRELLISTPDMNLYLDPQSGGNLFEWDWREKGFNLLNNLTRRPEGYHQALYHTQEQKEDEESLKTIHDSIRVKEEGLLASLHYDWYRRTALIDHFIHPDTEIADFRTASYGELGDFVDQPYLYRLISEDRGLEIILHRQGHVWQDESLLSLHLEKHLTVPAKGTELVVKYELANEAAMVANLLFGVESNFSLLIPHSPEAFYWVEGLELENACLDSIGETPNVQRFGIVNYDLGMEIILELTEPATLWRFPIETIANSESGLERVYQCSCILPFWNITLAPGQSWQVGLRFALLDKE